MSKFKVGDLVWIKFIIDGYDSGKTFIGIVVLNNEWTADGYEFQINFIGPKHQPLRKWINEDSFIRECSNETSVKLIKHYE
jgi:hypothetical protein